MKTSITASKPSKLPVIYVHAKGHNQASRDQLGALLELGLPLCSRLAHKAMVKTQYGFDQPGLLLTEIGGLFPGRPVVFVRAGLQLSRHMLDRLGLLLKTSTDPLALTILSNAEVSLNPFAGLQRPTQEVKFELGDLVGLLAPGHLHTLTSWPDHFVMLSVSAVDCLAIPEGIPTDANTTLLQRLTAAGGDLRVADDLFLHAPEQEVFSPLKLQPHESTQPPCFSELSARVQDWFGAGILRLPPFSSSDKPATLHITHSWGGGVASWLRSFAKTDRKHIHFQLRSEEARSNTNYGQKLSLYAGNELRCPIASWWLQPPISSVVEHDPAYQKTLEDICRRYGIGRLFVSSMIGHSLDALRTGLPTLRILHDHFPVWPLLSVNPKPYVRIKGGTDLKRALKEHQHEQEFPDKDATGWSKINAAYCQTIIRFNVKIAAPGNWVLDLQNKLDPSFREHVAKVIPHGFPSMHGLRPVLPIPRKDGRLRMVILGRIQTGKGKKLLSSALSELAEHVQVYLLGAGKSGEEFFGRPGVDVVLDYKRDELPGLLASIGPDFAALLSVVPETFSYTLSELQQLQIPTLATSTGGFSGRIEHAKTGWLIEPNATALISQVKALCRTPNLIESVRRKLPDIQAGTTRAMVDAYNKFCPAVKRVDQFLPVDAGTERVQLAATDYQRSLTISTLRQARDKHEELTREIKRRSEWASRTAKELKLEQQRREKWVGQLETEINRLHQEVEDKSAWALKTNEQMQLERTQGKSWLKQINQLTKKVETRTAWALKTDKELKSERRNRKKWVGALETEIRRLQREFEKKSAWALKANEQIQQERSQGKAWIKQIKQLTREVETRTEWALETDRELKLEQQRRDLWVGQLETETDRLGEVIADLQSELGLTGEQLASTQAELGSRSEQLNAKNAQLASLESRLSQLEADYQQATQFNALILGSSSWKITRPFRASRRVVRNFMQARAWNPLRWPWALAQLLRNLSTLGLGGTVQRLQRTGTYVEPEARPKVMPVLDTDPEMKMRFDSTSHPDVSIVIPVYNQWSYTAACLRSLLVAGSKYSFEVVIVDDQSRDETASELEQMEGLRCLRNKQNLGFVGSCNRGAEHAKGKFLVLLNNDTQVTVGWLDELIGTFDREPEAGLVGARLVYPDGSLQEAGGIIFNDGSGWNYGNGVDADNPEYHFLREVDYCSGACIALKTEYFHHLGGLDDRYAPAYYEDTDLAFKVRESGMKAFVQPASIVVHYEGITSGTDVSSGTKRFQVINQQKFLERWQDELKSHPDPVNDPNDQTALRKASRHRNMGNVLFIDATTPEPDKDAGSVRLTNLLRICRDMGYGVTFFADNRANTGRYTRDLQDDGIEVLYHPWLDSLQDFFSKRGAEFDYILVSRHYVAVNYIPLLKRYCPNARFIFDTVDLHYLREQRLAKLEQSKTLEGTARQTRRSELAVIKAADATLVVSAVEQTLLAKDAPGEKVHVLSLIHHIAGRDKSFAQRKDLFFVGGYQHPPNIDGACWFVKEVWPLIRMQLPKLKFHLIGSKAPQAVRSLHGNGVIFHGYVESLDSFVNDCRLTVAPIRYGAGIKGKISMSMAHGQPAVVSEIAAEGMFVEHETEILIAKDAEAFAREVVRLYQDEELWNRLSDAAVNTVEKHFSINAARDSLTKLFALLAK